MGLVWNITWAKSNESLSSVTQCNSKVSIHREKNHSADPYETLFSIMAKKWRNNGEDMFN